MSLFGTVKKRVARAGSSVKEDIKRRAKERSEERTFRKGVEKEARKIAKKTGREAYRRETIHRARIKAQESAGRQASMKTRTRFQKASLVLGSSLLDLSNFQELMNYPRKRRS